jgi:hypothetical protein
MERISTDQAAKYRRRADELRSEAGLGANATIRSELERIATHFEQLAVNLERVALRATER